MGEGRRLAAIVFTDLASFTREVQRDEAAALSLLDEQDRLLAPLLATFHGRKIKSMGDGMLLEFTNAKEAVDCSMHLQRTILERNRTGGSPELRMRVGIHLGDVEGRESDILGDAVNLAARIEPLAEVGGVCVSSQVYDQVSNKLPYRFVSLGRQSLKGFRAPVEVYRVAAAPTPDPSPVSLLPRLAVLPFSNISPNPEDAYFADGLTEEIISTLSKLRELCVISRTSVMQYKTGTRSIRDIGNDLHAGTIVEGSVRKHANRIRVTVQVIDSASDRHLWSESYDRDLADIFAIQSDLAQNVASALKVHVLAREKQDIERRPTESVAAYELYLRGRSLFFAKSDGYMAQAIQLFEQALSLDPKCAVALSAISDCYHDGSHAGRFTPEEAYPRMKDLALRALAIDPRLAEAHAALGAVYFHYDWKWEEAETELKAAIELKPSSAYVYEMFSYLLAVLGRAGESRRKAAVGLEISPQYYELGAWSLTGSWSWVTIGGRDEAGPTIQHLERYVRARPDLAFLREALGFAYARFGRTEEGIAELREAVRVSGGHPLYRGGLGVLLAASGHAEEAQTILAELKAGGEPLATSSVRTGCLLFLLGRTDEAFADLERAFDRKAIDIVDVRLVPELERLRNDARWRSIERRMGLEPIRAAREASARGLEPEERLSPRPANPGEKAG